MLEIKYGWLRCSSYPNEQAWLIWKCVFYLDSNTELINCLTHTNISLPIYTIYTRPNVFTFVVDITTFQPLCLLDFITWISIRAATRNSELNTLFKQQDRHFSFHCPCWGMYRPVLIFNTYQLLLSYFLLNPSSHCSTWIEPTLNISPNSVFFLSDNKFIPCTLNPVISSDK